MLRGLSSRRLDSIAILLPIVLGGLTQQGSGQVLKKTPANQVSASNLLLSSSGSTPMAQSKSLENYGKLPLSFEANQGQTDARVRFLSRGSGYSLFLTQDDAVFSLRGSTVKPTAKARTIGRPPQPDLPATSVVLRMKLVNANPSAKVIGEEELAGKSNYFVGNDPKKWSTNVTNYAKVKYEGVYSGIDLVYYGNQRQLEYDFVVSPGADPRSIEFNVDEAKHIRRDQSGDLVLQMAEGAVRWHKPVIYQEQDGTRHKVEGNYAIKPGKRVGFEVASYDTERPLIIDPVLTFSTYTDDSENGGPVAVAIDAEGNTYLTGLTFSAAYPVTPGAFQTSCKSCSGQYPTPDVYVTKLNATGTAQVYSTFLGGSDYDWPSGIAVDKNGNAVVAGRTESTDFPVKNNIPAGYSNVGTWYGFVTSLAADGSSLNYSSILGGGAQPGQGSETIVSGIALDPSGNSYISGKTSSSVFPVTSGAINGGTPSTQEFLVFATKFLTNGSLAYSALVGNPTSQQSEGWVSAIQVDNLGSAYLTGQAGSLWPMTAGAYQAQIGGPATYAPFVTKLSPDASSLAYSTFLGNGNPTALTINPSGDAWITGSPGAGFPTTSNAYIPNEPPGACCFPFFAELDETGSHLLYASFFYGSPVGVSSTSNSIAIDQLGNIWLAGFTKDPQLPLLHPVQSLLGAAVFGPRSGFVSRFDPTGTKLTFSTLFGDPSGQTEISAMALDSSNKPHIAGFAAPDLFTTPGAFLSSITPPDTSGFAAIIDPDAVAPSLVYCLPNEPRTLLG